MGSHKTHHTGRFRMIAKISGRCYNISEMKLQYPTLSLRRFAPAYEDLPAFHAAYFMLVLVFAGLCNLGFFACLILLHIILDYVKYRMKRGYGIGKALQGMMRESLLDVSLFFLALSTSVYLHPLVLGSGYSDAQEMQITLMRALALLLPKLTILHHTLRIAFNLPGYMSHIHPHIGKSFTLINHMCISVLGIAVILLLASPVLLHVSGVTLQEILREQLLPWSF